MHRRPSHECRVGVESRRSCPQGPSGRASDRAPRRPGSTWRDQASSHRAPTPSWVPLHCFVSATGSHPSGPRRCGRRRRRPRAARAGLTGLPRVSSARSAGRRSGRDPDGRDLHRRVRSRPTADERLPALVTPNPLGRPLGAPATPNDNSTSSRQRSPCSVSMHRRSATTRTLTGRHRAGHEGLRWLRRKSDVLKTTFAPRNATADRRGSLACDTLV